MAELPHDSDPSLNRPLITICIMLATVMQVLDTTIANVALPNMQGSLGATRDQITWVLTSYIVAAAIMTPVTGWIADRFGRREVFLASVAGFTAASMLCGIASNLSMMVVFRVVQGICGAALVPLSQAVLLDINPRERHGQAMAIWGAGIMVGPIVGPVLGGWLTDTFNWRWAFYVNLPVGLLALLGMMIYLPKSNPRQRGFDFFGFAMLSLAVGAIQMMLDRGDQLDWFSSTEIWLELGLAISGAWVFVIHTATAERPFLDPHIFRDRNLTTALLLIFMVGIILLAGLALMPPMLQSTLGYPVITAGIVLAPRGVGTMISMILVGRLVQKVDARILIFFGLSVTAFSLYQMTGFSPQMGKGPIIVSGVVQGLGLGFVFVPLSTLAFATLEPRFRTDAASLFSLVRNIGSSIGISIVTVMLAHNLQVSRTELVSALTPFNQNLDSLPNIGGQQTMLAMLDNEVTRQSLMIGYIDDFELMMLITLTVIPLVFFLRKPARPPASMAQAVAAD
jgi:DHA2 family multidrug resistance protein